MLLKQIEDRQRTRPVCHEGIETLDKSLVVILEFLKYQAIMVEQDDVEIVVTNTVNPASFLSGSMGEPVIHECLEAIEATCSSCLDLKDTLLENTETWSTDGSSSVISGRHAGYVVTMSREVIESGPLPTNTSAQEAEITA
ncbi:hypothetical protein DUI87_20837 [Hirundo rustica rustica]|uniref:RNase H type-1 domain-containing protein n=1 Tax=Hirundo rustica rustica TaxID=333673 RepID=A0A3M0JTJ3_HIRRU|nr:hypothetical protein DUI87_20837 [Hirundo rustica rustica]